MMTSKIKQLAIERSEKLLDAFHDLGVPKQGGNTLGKGITFEGLEVWKLILAVREATLLERVGGMIPDTNRMGLFVGWHLTLHP